MTRRPGRSGWRRGGVAAADQVMSSLSNTLAVILIARSMDAVGFGVFSLAYAVLILALGLCRAFFGTTISLQPDPDGARSATVRSTGGVLAVTPVLLLAVPGFAWLMAPQGDWRILALVAVAAPVVCLQDTLRFGAIAEGRPGRALASDTLWCVAVATPLFLGLAVDAVTALLIWVASAIAALALLLVLTRIRPSVAEGWTDLRSPSSMSLSMAYVSLLGQGATLAVLAVVARTIGPEGSGALRGASGTMLGPISVAFAFVTIALTPALSRRGEGAVRKFCAATGAVLAVGVVLWGAVILLLPDSVGQEILGASWAGVREVLPFTVVEYVWLALNTSATLGLKVQGQARTLRRQRLLMSSVALGVGAAAAVVVGSTVAVAAALALAAAVSALFGWAALIRRSSPHGRSTAAAGG